MNLPFLFSALAAGVLTALIAGRPALERAYGRFLSPQAGTAAKPQEVPLSLPGVLGLANTQGESQAAVVLDAGSGRVLAEAHAFTPLPIASLTKIMSAMVALDQHPDLRQIASILPTEYSVRGGNLRLANNERVTVRDLLFASLTGSANNAAFALPRVLGIPDDHFLREMHRKAVSLGLESFHFVDVAGLSPRNIGNAYDVARLAAHALTYYPLIAEALAAPEYRLVALGTGREHNIRHSNPLLRELGPRTESKTGYLHEALYCIVLTKIRGAGRLVAVLLGHPNEYGVVREADALLNTVNITGGGDSPARE